jgi:hypothetical protein
MPRIVSGPDFTVATRATARRPRPTLSRSAHPPPHSCNASAEETERRHDPRPAPVTMPRHTDPRRRPGGMAANGPKGRGSSGPPTDGPSGLSVVLVTSAPSGAHPSGATSGGCSRARAGLRGTAPRERPRVARAGAARPARLCTPLCASAGRAGPDGAVGSGGQPPYPRDISSKKKTGRRVDRLAARLSPVTAQPVAIPARWRAGSGRPTSCGCVAPPRGRWPARARVARAA